MHQKIFSQAKDDQVGKPMKPGLGHEHKETGNVKNIEHGHGVYILYINKRKQFMSINYSLKCEAKFMFI
jgi:hypothetical protein